MNVFSRGIKNAFRNPIKSGAIILMLAISICLILSMLVAKNSVDTKINEVKSNVGTNITVSAAGVMGFSGSGTALTSDDLATVTKTDHITSTISTLTDRMSEDDTTLESSQEMGNLGQNFGNGSSSTSTSDSSSTTTDSSSSSDKPDMSSQITLTGTTDADSVSTDGSDLNITSGETFDGSSSNLVALVGSDLADENDLSVGDTFTAYDKTITVVGIFETDNKFQDSGLIMPLATVQTITDQADAISSITAKVDSSDNVDSTVTALKSALRDSADITSEAEQAANSVSSLESISSLTVAGVIASTIAGAVIVLLAMIMIVRERRREIGVIKAIGGTNKKVIAQFVSEALTLTVIGSIIGLTLGVLVSGPMTTSLVSNSTSSSSSKTSSAPSASGQSTDSSSSSSKQGGPGAMMQQGMDQIGTNFTQVTASLTPMTFMIAVGITLLIAIVGSAVPAWFIARVRPAEVLRTE